MLDNMILCHGVVLIGGTQGARNPKTGVGPTLINISLPPLFQQRFIFLSLKLRLALASFFPFILGFKHGAVNDFFLRHL